jgi:uncharacterized protein (TIGR03545 family)
MKKSKIPGLFQKKYSSKALNKKIIKRIHIPKDREMIRDLFIKNSDGKMEIVHDIPEEVLIRLKPLAKSIKKNKGMVSRWKSSILIFIIAAILIFNFFFKDKLITNAVESGLESVFKAEVEINKLKLSLLKGTISYNSLTIADAENTSRNLIETGFAEFRVNIEELTKKRIRIEEMSMTEVKWDTLRETDGALAESAPDEKDKNSGGVSKAFDVLALDSGEYDFIALLEDQKSNLTSLNLINQGNEEIDAFTQEWEGIYSEKEKEIKDLISDVEELKSMSILDTRSIEEGQAIAKKVQDLYPRVTKTKDGLIALQHDFIEDKNSLIDLKEMITSAVDDDIAYLYGMLDLSSGNIRSLASDAAEIYIRNRWNDYYEKGLKALEVYERFQDIEKKESKEKKGIQRNSGRNISFLSPDNPGFLIEHILLSGGDSTSGTFTTEIQTVTNEPDKLTDPLTFLVDWGSGQSTIKMNGVLDMRTYTELPFLMEIESPGNLFSMEDGFAALNISGLSSKAEISGVSKAVKNENTVMTTLEIILTEINIEQENEEGFISEAVRDILSDLKRIDLSAEILINRDGLESVKVVSDLDDILSDRIGGYIKEKADNAEEDLRNGLEEYLSSSLEENQVLQSSVTALDVKSMDQISSVNDLEKNLDNKQNELENQANSLLAEQEAEAARLKAEAEKKAQDEASKLLEKATDKIKIPGF